MRRNTLRLLSLLAILALFSVWAFGQAESGAINGIVTDKTGAVVVGANVTATSIDTGLVRTTTTKSAGEYTITNLPPKTYDVTIEAQGFQKYTQRVKVGVGSMNDVSAKLSVTGASTTVEVTGSAETAVVNTENQTLSQVINSQEVSNLPTLTRNPYDLVATSGNVVEDTNSGRGAGYAINGARSADTDILLDGGENVNLFDTTVGQSVPLDTVQEFSVLTSNYSAEYGRAGGGIINVATKSGTNAFHGSLYEFNRVSALAANTEQNNANRAQAFADGSCVIGQPCDIGKFGFTRNQFGYSIGGPIVKNKLFFFSGTEWTRVRSNTAQSADVIDPAFLALPQVNANTKNFFNQYGKNLASGVSVLSLVNWGQATNGACPPPLACNAPFGQAVSYNVPADSGGGAPQNTYSTVNRVDWNINDKNTLYGRYALYSEDQLPGSWTNSPYAGYNTGQTFYNQGVDINYTHVFTPSLVNSLKLNYNRLNNKQPLSTNPVSPTLYTSTGVPVLPGTSGQLVFPGYNAYTPGNAVPFGGPQNLYQIYEDLSWTKGKHQFKFGGTYLQLRDNRIFGAYENPIEPLGTSLAGRKNYSDYTSATYNLVNGSIYQFQGAVYPQGKFPCDRGPGLTNIQNGNGPGQPGTNGLPIPTPGCTLQLPVGPPSFGRNNRFNDGNFYVNDSWKLTPRLTVNLGLRWEYYGVQHNANAALDSNFYLGAGSTIYDQIRNGSVQIANQSPVGGLWAPDKNNWAPRVGFAWDMFGDGSTSLRGGFGMGYERDFGNVTFNVIQNPPNYAVVALTSSSLINYPIFTDVSGPLAGTGSAILPSVNLRAVQQNIPTAYTEFWSVAIDRQVMKNAVASIEYVGSKGNDLYSISDINQQGFGGIFTGVGNRLNYQYNEINYRGANAFSRYNGVNLKFQGNNLFNKGLFLTANYTWSHSIDDLSSTFTDGNNGNYMLGYTNAFFPKLDTGSSDFDTRNRFVMSGTWNLPWGNNYSNEAAKQILGGWSVSTIFVAHSGNPFTIYDCTNGIYATCPRWIPGTPFPIAGGLGTQAGPNLYNYMSLPQGSSGLPVGTGQSLSDPVCTGLDGVGCSFSLSGAQPGGRNSFASPGYWNFDFVFAKNFKLTERFNLQFRSELYNAFNHHNVYILSNNLDVSGGLAAVQADKGGTNPYGPGSQYDERRNIQFALKLLF
ncbi:MAG: carboxypeptidase regulatory-like domain-containing protein [Candidatus Korobacteraceae bacterium]